MNVRFTNRSIAFSIFIFILIPFVIFIPWLGFYRQDWLILAAARFTDPVRMISDSLGSTPFLAWLQLLPVRIFEHRAYLWQVYALLTKFLAALSMWWALQRLWKNHVREVTWMAFLFSIIPVFDKQNMAVMSSALWLAFATYFVSVALMIIAFRSNKLSWLYLMLSLVSQVFFITSFPYYWGLELVRPVILWFLAVDQSTFRSRSWRTFLWWIPYLVVIITFYFLRYLLFPVVGIEGSTSNLLSELLPGGILAFLQTVFRELVNLVFGSWYRTFEPLQILLNDISWIISIFIGILAGGIAAIYLAKLEVSPKMEENSTINSLFLPQSFVLGSAALLLGLLPYWVTGMASNSPVAQSSYLMTAMFGLSVLVIAGLESAIANKERRLLLFCILIGLAVAYHLRIANDYRWQWKDQNRFFWQLYWRAPDIQPETTLFSDSPFFTDNGGSIPFTASLDLLYAPGESATGFSYLFNLLNPNQSELKLEDAVPPGSQNRLITLTYEPENSNCLWVLAPSDVERPQVSKLARDSIQYTNLDRIGNNPGDRAALLETLFGKEPERTWCYFYEKAELARQSGDFESIGKLGDQLRKAGYEPNNVQEWLPFIDGYAKLNQWSEARKLSDLVYQTQPSFSDWLCSSWERILTEVKPDAENKAKIDEMLAGYSCSANQ